MYRSRAIKREVSGKRLQVLFLRGDQRIKGLEGL